MGSYGRQFDFLQVPDVKHRLGRFKTGDDPIVMGCPVTGGVVTDALDDRRIVTQAAEGDLLKTGSSGIIVAELPYTGYQDRGDRDLLRPSDIDTVPAGHRCQVVHGDETRFWLRNVAALDFEGQRDYPAVTMVAGDLEDLDIDDFLGAGPGGTDGHWKEVAENLAWARVTACYPDHGLVQAQMLR